MLLFHRSGSILALWVTGYMLATASASAVALSDDSTHRHLVLEEAGAILRDDISPITRNSEGGPLRYIDRYGIPGEGPVPGVTIGTPGAPYNVGSNASESPEGTAVPEHAPTVEQAKTTSPPAKVEEPSKKKKVGKKTKKQQKKGKHSAVTSKPAVPPRVVTTPELQYDPIREALFDVATKEYDKAISRVDKLLALNPNHPYAHYVKAVANVMLHKYHEAALEYKEVLRLVPNSALANRASEGLRKLSNNEGQ